jgi:hypothetical protein
MSVSKARTTWPQLIPAEKLRGLWVALDNCRYDQTTRQPIEGDVVDADEDLTELCHRMQEVGRTACAILFCDDDVVVDSPPPSRSRPAQRYIASR